jgi:glucokinase
VLLLNDFEALALALPSLSDADVEWIGTPRPDRTLPMAVIGPGTGLGVSSCVPVGAGWVAIAAEGGHVTAPAADDFEADVLRAMRREHAHVSAERALSGIGLPTLHRAVSSVRGAAVETLAAEEITRRAIDEGNADCRATLDTFCAMLGTFAGNVALTVGARGGVYIAGGIAQKLGADLLGARFRARFEAKGRFSDYLARIATGLITARHAALAGAAQALVQTPAGTTR